jgi:hypothetical protein
LKFLVVSDREYRNTSRGIDIITTYLVEKGYFVDHMLFYRKEKIPEKKLGEKFRQIYFRDFLGLYKDQVRPFFPGFLLSLYFSYIISKQKDIDFNQYDFVVLESGYPTYLGLCVKNKIIYRQSDAAEIAFNSNRLFYRKLEFNVIKKAVIVSSALQDMFYPSEYANKFVYWHSGFIPIKPEGENKATKAFVFMGGGEIDIKLIKKIANIYPDYTFHVIGAFDKKHSNKNVIFHGYLEYNEYQKLVAQSSICIIPFSKRFVHQLRRCYFTAKILIPMSLGMPILLKGYGLVKKSDPAKKLFVYKNNKEALILLDKIVRKVETGEINRTVLPETEKFLLPQTAENRLKELDNTFQKLLQ